MKQTMIQSKSGVIFSVTPVNGQFRIHVHKIAENEEQTKWVEVYSKCIKKYSKFEHCNEFFNKFEAMSEDDKEIYVGRYMIGKGKQNFNGRKSGDYVMKRTVSKVLFVRRNLGGWQRFESYTNPKQLEMMRDKFHENGYETYVDTGAVRFMKILKSEVNNVNLFFEEISPSYGASTITKSKKAMQAKFWNNK
jgi:hypothetical protein